jgi:hypothetical protein
MPKGGCTRQSRDVGESRHKRFLLGKIGFVCIFLFSNPYVFVLMRAFRLRITSQGGYALVPRYGTPKYSKSSSIMTRPRLF